MQRREFVRVIAAVGAGGVTAVAAAEAEKTKKAAKDAMSVQLTVAGFSCVTCAVGLDTLLRERKGILSCESTYPEGKVNVRFASKEISERDIEAAIGEMGFRVMERQLG
jgi:Cu+-exporting ATPase